MFHRGTDDKDLLFVITWVDDCVITGPCVEAIVTFKTELSAKYEMKDLGLIERFLGISVRRDEDSITMTQEAYVTDMLHRYQMFDCKPAPTPAEEGHVLSMSDAVSIVEAAEASKYPIREAVGSLLFLSQMTRPDISNRVREVCRMVGKASDSVVKAIKRIFRYLRGTRK